MIENQAKDSVTPMRIFVRASKKAYVEQDLIFKVNDDCIRYYEKLFSREYPFDKYDTVYCPEFRISAMENVAATFFTDRLLLPLDE